MKNRSFFYFTLLAFMLLACSHLSAAAFHYHVPPKPAHGISDDAKVFDQASLATLQIYSERKVLKRVIIQPYVLTIKDTLWSHIDTIITMVCSSWHMYGVDSFALLIMSDAREPRFRIVTGHPARLTLDDTLATYLCTKRLPDLCRSKGAFATTRFFLDCIQLDIYSHKINFEDYYTDSKYYKENETDVRSNDRMNLQTEYFEYKFNYGRIKPLAFTISRWQVGLFCFICTALMVIYRIFWFRYRSAVR